MPSDQPLADLQTFVSDVDRSIQQWRYSLEQQGTHAISEKEQPVIRIETTELELGELPEQSIYQSTPRGGESQRHKCYIPRLKCDTIGATRSKCGWAPGIYGCLEEHGFGCFCLGNELTCEFGQPDIGTACYPHSWYLTGSFTFTACQGPYGDCSGSVSTSCTVDPTAGDSGACFSQPTWAESSCSGAIVCDNGTLCECPGEGSPCVGESPMACITVGVGHSEETFQVSNEYTEELLIAITISKLPDYDDSFNDEGVASRDLDQSFPNTPQFERTYTIRRFRYKFTFDNPTLHACTVRWVERTYDAYGEAIPELDNILSETVSSGAMETSTYELLEPNQNGTAKVWLIGACCIEGDCSWQDYETCVVEMGGTIPEDFDCCIWNGSDYCDGPNPCPTF